MLEETEKVILGYTCYVSKCIINENEHKIWISKDSIKNKIEQDAIIDRVIDQKII